MSQLKEYKPFIEPLEKFLVGLRNRDHVTQEDYQLVVQAFSWLKSKISDSSGVEKPLVSLLVDIYPQMEGVIHQYNEEKAEEIDVWKEDILELIHDCLEG